MTRTKHGHHIPGSTHDDEKFHLTPQPCGGAFRCIDCAVESGHAVRVVNGNFVVTDLHAKIREAIHTGLVTYGEAGLFGYDEQTNHISEAVIEAILNGKPWRI